MSLKLANLAFVVVFSTNNVAIATTTPTNATAPVCAADEKLFQLRLLTGEEYSWNRAPASYRVFTESTGEVHAECTGCNNYYPGADVQLCLPTDGCHTVVVGRLIGIWVSCYNGGIEELLVNWGGETIRSSNAYFFDRIDFGEGCQADPLCHPDQEMEFEFFLDRDKDSRYPDPFAWDLAEVATGETLVQGQAPYNESAFVYERACVPRSSCLEFYMGYPFNTTSSGFYDSSSYSIRLDGVIYDEYELRMGVDLLANPDKLNMTVNLGSCTVELVCNATAEDLFAMEFTTEAFVACYNYHNDFNYSSAIATYDFPFWLQNLNDDYYENYYVWTGHFEAFEVNRSYAVMSCIPNDECAKFYFGTENSVVGYSLFQNGEELTQRVVNTGENNPSEGLTTTSVGTCASGATLLLTQGRVPAAALTVLTLLNVFW